APPPLGIAFRVSLVAPPRSVRGPDGAEWGPSAGTPNGPLSAPRPPPTISPPTRDRSRAVPRPPPRCAPLPPAHRDPPGHQPRPDRRSAAQGVLPMVLPLPFLTRRPTVPAKDGASWPHVVILGGGFAGAHAVEALRDVRVRVTLIDRNVYKTFQPLLYQ